MKEGWEYKKLEEVGRVITGSTPSTKSPENYSSKDVCFVKPSDLPKDGVGLVIDTEFHISKKAYNNSRKLPKGSVLTTCIGIVGKVAILQVDATCNQQINAIIPDATISSHFLAYSILSKRDYLEKRANAPVVPIINKKDFSSTVIAVPSLSEQQHIVEELDLLSSIIEKKKVQLNELDNLAQSLFYEMFGDPISNEKGWEVKKLGKLCITSSGGTPSKTHKEYYEGGNIPWLRSGEVAQGYIYNTEMYITEEGLNNSSAKYFPINTVVVAMYGATVGQVGILKSRMTTNQAICGIFPSESFVPTFLMFFLKGMKPVYLKDAAGGAQPNISQGVIKNTLVPIVSIALQQQFVERIEAIEHQKELIKQSIKEVETLFNSRMDYYFN